MNGRKKRRIGKEWKAHVASVKELERKEELEIGGSREETAG